MWCSHRWELGKNQLVKLTTRATSMSLKIFSWMGLHVENLSQKFDDQTVIFVHNVVHMKGHGKQLGDVFTVRAATERCRSQQEPCSIEQSSRSKQVSGDMVCNQQKNGANALGLQRVLGLGSYRTAWTWLQKLRRVMVRPSVAWTC
jgi:hypothetical protein